MTIRDMETATGLTRANIRFYESQGFISPQRQENNYRSYTKQDADILLRVKLLRALGMGLEEIRELQKGTEILTTALDRRIIELSRERESLRHAQTVAAQMRTDNVRYDTLDAARYLDLLNQPRSSQPPLKVPAQDAEPRIFAPWQRYWARYLDQLICSMVVMLAITWFDNGKLPSASFATTLLSLGLLMVLEALCLTLFGTTPGKWIFGIRVVGLDGRKPRFWDAFRRTGLVILWGLGLGIPFFSLYRLYKSYKGYEKEEELPWEHPTEVLISNTKSWRYFAAAAAALAVFAGAIAGALLLGLPEHRGDLTPAQFCQNYSRIAHQQNILQDEYTLLEDGTWQYRKQDGTLVIYTASNYTPVDFQFTTEEGIITAVTISEELSGPGNDWISGRKHQMSLMALALLTSRDGYTPLDNGREQAILNQISENRFQNFESTAAGLTFTYQVEHQGYRILGDTLAEDDDPATESYYAMSFTIRRAD